MTSDLGTEKWAVLSDRGCEAKGLTYDEARRSVHRLTGEGRHGLCIVTDRAARHLNSVPEKQASPKISEPA